MGLPEPHGGRLVDRTLGAAESERRRSEASVLPSVGLTEEAAFDLEKIAVGAYSPLTGFQGSADLEAILEQGRRADGTPWGLPILLAQPPIDKIGSRGPGIGDEVLLRAPSGRPIGLLRLEEVYPIPKSRVAERIYGTTDTAHPNVADLAASPSHAWAGPIELLDWPELPDRSLERSPAELRERFRAHGWSNVAAYQCRNPPHTAHELLQRQTLEREEIDGLLIHPVVGRLKAGDYRPQIILQSYRVLTERYLPADRVELASLSISMRYAGPRAALFLATVRKNFGCRSYIVGRDQAGVGRYYEP
ncbi:sulfate adenylyltransferase, partial [mine drainage metagenome]